MNLDEDKKSKLADSMPFSDEIKKYIKKYPDFEQSLKLYNPKRFEVLHTILLSRCPNYPDDEIIGIFYFDKKNHSVGDEAVFKQDYIVRSGNIFISYTGLKCNSVNAKMIGKFFQKYGQGKYYGTESGRGDHHYNSVSELPPPLRVEATAILNVTDVG